MLGLKTTPRVLSTLILVGALFAATRPCGRGPDALRSVQASPATGASLRVLHGV